jgi:hypothetical protein
MRNEYALHHIFLLSTELVSAWSSLLYCSEVQKYFIFVSLNIYHIKNILNKSTNSDDIYFILQIVLYVFRSPDSAFGKPSGYGLDDRGVGVRVPMGEMLFTTQCCPNRLWDPPSLLSHGYRVLFPWGWSAWGVKLTTQLQLVPRSKKYRSIYPFSWTPSCCSA